MVGSRPRGRLHEYIYRNVEYKHRPYVFTKLVFESNFNKLKGLLLGRVSSKKGLGMFWGVFKKKEKSEFLFFSKHNTHNTFRRGGGR